jgi:MEMO1 family protein
MKNIISMEIYPKLRALDFQPVLYQGQQMWFLRDPLRLSANQIFVPEHMTPLFAFMDGNHTSKEIHNAFCLFTGAKVPYEVIDDALNRLDMAYLLENDHSRKVLEEQLNSYRSEPYRAPALAGHSYPDQPDELAKFLENFTPRNVSETDLPWAGRGMISPHIDYQRGGPVYAQVWSRAGAAIQAADLIIIFGTDHNGGPGEITLTRQPYATPFGVLPTDEKLIDKLAQAVGEKPAFNEELHHRDEHSIELSAVWLHYILQRNGSAAKPMIPVLVGSFQHFLTNGEHPINDQRLNSFIDVLQKETNGRRVLAVASVDLSHVGPNFGDSFTIDEPQKTDIKESDQSLISAALNGDAGSWFNQIASIHDRNRICGFAPTYLLLRYLGATNGFQIAYDQCPADSENFSIVSICGLLIN